MTLKRILTIGALSLLAATAVYGQNDAGGSVTVVSDPPGAEVTLDGAVTVSGVTPAIFNQTLIGDYRLKISRHGYENYKTRLVIDPSKPMQFDVTLSRKTKFKAAIRSMVIPGWGQRYGDQKTKGYIFSFLAVGSVTAFLIADDDFRAKRDRYDDRLAEYDALKESGTYEQLAAFKPSLDQAQEDAYDAETWRRAAVGAVIGAWSISLLDAIFFFPEEHGTFSVKGLTIAPEAGADGVNLSISTKF